MPPSDRRTFLKTTSAGVGAVLIGCDSGSGSSAGTFVAPDVDLDAFATDNGNLPEVGPGPDAAEIATPEVGPEDVAPEVEIIAPPQCADPFEGGTHLGNMSFLDEGNPPMDTPYGTGLDGREYFDLENLTIDDPLTPIEKFYIRTRLPGLIDYVTPWSIEVTGLVSSPITLTMDDLQPLIEEQGVWTLECSGNGPFSHFGMLSATTWRGVKIDKILEMVDIDPSATAVRITGFDEHSQPSANSDMGASWIFKFQELARSFAATHMGGEPLQEDHGFPVRLFNPGWYGCTCVKWLTKIELVDDTAPPTGQMVEYASRTHQNGVPPLAKDWIPATLDQTAMPIRVEKWSVDGAIKYRIVGIMWGGYEVTDGLTLRLGAADPVPVDVCPEQATNNTWTIWSHLWEPPATGEYDMFCGIDDPSIVTKRLDTGFYRRTVLIDEV